jgi:hypothetical protein
LVSYWPWFKRSMIYPLSVWFLTFILAGDAEES